LSENDIIPSSFLQSISPKEIKTYKAPNKIQDVKNT